MKRLPLLLAAFIMLLLVGCQSTPAETEPPTDDGLITYPGTHWNMTPEELTKILGIAESDITVYIDTPRSETNQTGEYQIGVNGINVYGYPATIGFTFRSYTDDSTLGLCEVIVLYDDGVDMEAVRQSITTQLGAPTGEDDTYPYVYWDSQALLHEYMSDEAVETMRSNYTMNPNLPNGEELLNHFLTSPAIRLFWVNGPEIDLPSPPVHAGAKALCFEGSVTEMIQRYGIAHAG